MQSWDLLCCQAKTPEARDKGILGSNLSPLAFKIITHVRLKGKMLCIQAWQLLQQHSQKRIVPCRLLFVTLAGPT